MSSQSQFKRFNILQELEQAIKKKTHQKYKSKSKSKQLEVKPTKTIHLDKPTISQTRKNTQVSNNKTKCPQFKVKKHQNKKFDKIVSLINYTITSADKALKYVNLSSNFQAEFAYKLYLSDRQNLMNQLNNINILQITSPQNANTNFINSIEMKALQSQQYSNIETHALKNENDKLKKQIMILESQLKKSRHREENRSTHNISPLMNQRPDQNKEDLLKKQIEVKQLHVNKISEMMKKICNFTEVYDYLDSVQKEIKYRTVLSSSNISGFELSRPQRQEMESNLINLDKKIGSLEMKMISKTQKWQEGQDEQVVEQLQTINQLIHRKIAPILKQMQTQPLQNKKISQMISLYISTIQKRQRELKLANEKLQGKLIDFIQMSKDLQKKEHHQQGKVVQLQKQNQLVKSNLADIYQELKGILFSEQQGQNDDITFQILLKQVQDLLNNKKYLVQEVKNKQQAISKLNKNLNKLESQANSLKQALKVEKQNTQERQEFAIILQNSKKQQQKQIVQLKYSYNHLQKQLQEVHKENQDLIKELEEAQLENQKTVQQIQYYKNQMTALNEKENNDQDQLNMKNQIIHQKELKIEQLSTENIMLRQEMNEFKQNITRVTEEKDKILQHMRYLQERLKQTESNQEVLVEQCNEKLRQITTQNQENQRKFQIIQKQKTHWQTMYNNILQTNNSEAYRFEKHIESLEQHIQQLSNANTSLNQQNSGLLNQFRMIQTQKIQNQSKIINKLNILEEQREAYLRQIDGLRLQLEQKSQMIQKLRLQKTERSNEFERQNSHQSQHTENKSAEHNKEQFLQLQPQLSSQYNQQIAQLTTELDQQRRDNEFKNKSYQSLKRDNLQLTSQIQKYQIVVWEQRTKLQNLQQQFKTLHQQDKQFQINNLIYNFQEKINTLTQKLQNQEQQNFLLKGELRTKHDIILENEEQVQNLMIKIEQLRSSDSLQNKEVQQISSHLVEEIKQNLVKKQQECKQLQNTIVALQTQFIKENKQLNQANVELTVQIESMQQTIKQLNFKLNEAQQQLNNIQNAVNQQHQTEKLKTPQSPIQNLEDLSSQNKIQKQEGEVNQFQNQSYNIDVIESKYKRLISDLKEQIENKQSQLNDIRKRQAENQIHIIDLGNQLNIIKVNKINQDIKYQQLQAQVNNLYEQISMERRNNDRFKQEIQSNRNEYIKKMEEGDQQIQTLKRQLQQKQSFIQGTDQRYKQLEFQLVETKRTKEQYIQALENKCAMKDIQVQTYVKKMDVYITQQDSYRLQIGSLSSKVEEQQKQISQLRNDLQCVQKKWQTLNQEKLELQSNFNEKIQQHDHHKNLLQKKIEELSLQCNSKNEDEQIAILALHETIKQKESEIEQLNQKLQNMQAQIQDKEAKQLQNLQQLQEEVSKIRNDLQKSKTQNEQLQQRVNQLQQKQSQMKQNLQEKIQSLKKLSERIEQLEQSLEEKNILDKQKEQQAQRINLQLQELKQSKRNQVQQIQKVNEIKINNLKNSLQQLQDKLQKSQQSNLNLMMSLNNVNQKIQVYKKQIQILKNQNEQLKDIVEEMRKSEPEKNKQQQILHRQKKEITAQNNQKIKELQYHIKELQERLTSKEVSQIGILKGNNIEIDLNKLKTESSEQQKQQKEDQLKIVSNLTTQKEKQIKTLNQALQEKEREIIALYESFQIEKNNFRNKQEEYQNQICYLEKLVQSHREKEESVGEIKIQSKKDMNEKRQNQKGYKKGQNNIKERNEEVKKEINNLSQARSKQLAFHQQTHHQQTHESAEQQKPVTEQKKQEENAFDDFNDMASEKMGDSMISNKSATQIQDSEQKVEIQHVQHARSEQFAFHQQTHESAEQQKPVTEQKKQEENAFDDFNDMASEKMGDSMISNKSATQIQDSEQKVEIQHVQHAQSEQFAFHQQTQESAEQQKPVTEQKKQEENAFDDFNDMASEKMGDSMISNKSATQIQDLEQKVEIQHVQHARSEQFALHQQTHESAEQQKPVTEQKKQEENAFDDFNDMASEKMGDSMISNKSATQIQDSEQKVEIQHVQHARSEQFAFHQQTHESAEQQKPVTEQKKQEENAFDDFNDMASQKMNDSMLSNKSATQIQDLEQKVEIQHVQHARSEQFALHQQTHESAEQQKPVTEQKKQEENAFDDFNEMTSQKMNDSMLSNKSATQIQDSEQKVEIQHVQHARSEQFAFHQQTHESAEQQKPVTEQKKQEENAFDDFNDMASEKMGDSMISNKSATQIQDSEQKVEIQHVQHAQSEQFALHQQTHESAEQQKLVTEQKKQEENAFDDFNDMASQKMNDSMLSNKSATQIQDSEQKVEIQHVQHARSEQFAFHQQTHESAEQQKLVTEQKKQEENAFDDFNDMASQKMNDSMLSNKSATQIQDSEQKVEIQHVQHARSEQFAFHQQTHESAEQQKPVTEQKKQEENAFDDFNDMASQKMNDSMLSNKSATQIQDSEQKVEIQHVQHARSEQFAFHQQTHESAEQQKPVTEQKKQEENAFDDFNDMASEKMGDSMISNKSATQIQDLEQKVEIQHVQHSRSEQFALHQQTHESAEQQKPVTEQKKQEENAFDDFNDMASEKMGDSMISNKSATQIQDSEQKVEIQHVQHAQSEQFAFHQQTHESAEQQKPVTEQKKQEENAFDDFNDMASQKMNDSMLSNKSATQIQDSEQKVEIQHVQHARSEQFAFHQQTHESAEQQKPVTEQKKQEENAFDDFNDMASEKMGDSMISNKSATQIQDLEQKVEIQHVQHARSEQFAFHQQTQESAEQQKLVTEQKKQEENAFDDFNDMASQKMNDSMLSNKSATQIQDSEQKVEIQHVQHARSEQFAFHQQTQESAEQQKLVTEQKKQEENAFDDFNDMASQKMNDSMLSNKSATQIQDSEQKVEIQHVQHARSEQFAFHQQTHESAEQQKPVTEQKKQEENAFDDFNDMASEKMGDSMISNKSAAQNILISPSQSSFNVNNDFQKILPSHISPHLDIIQSQQNDNQQQQVNQLLQFLPNRQNDNDLDVNFAQQDKFYQMNIRRSVQSIDSKTDNIFDHFGSNQNINLNSNQNIKFNSSQNLKEVFTFQDILQKQNQSSNYESEDKSRNHAQQIYENKQFQFSQNSSHNQEIYEIQTIVTTQLHQTQNIDIGNEFNFNFTSTSKQVQNKDQVKNIQNNKQNFQDFFLE